MLSEKVATLTTQLAKAKQALENSAGAEARLTQAVGDAEKKHSATVDMYEEKLSKTEQRELEAETRHRAELDALQQEVRVSVEHFSCVDACYRADFW